MTSTADTAQHPDVSEISDLTEGLLPPSRTAEVRRHVDGCALCGDVRTSLEEIRSLLGTLPGPQPMPEDIAGRIDAALAAEALLDSTVPGEGVDVSRETSTPAKNPTDSAAPSEALPGQRTHATPADRPAGRPPAPTGPGRRTSGRRRRTAVLGAAFGAAVITMGIVFLQPFQGSQDKATTMADRSTGADGTSARSFSEGTLEGTVQDLLRATTASQSPRGQKQQPDSGTKTTGEVGSPEAAEATTPDKPLRAAAVDVPPCVQQATGRNTAALAVDEGRYQGRDAFLVVLPHATDTTRVQAYVVAATCVGAGPGAKGQLLLTRPYSRS
ncbi:hypothetical protein OHA98_00940 [Streptomyces sp. NBC_00654]|uniref:hypothetical protein n=1 Tax=Streptomyces sp. NBC_00654 TaxID=2975799 RepID=UPI00224D3B64|nr:hypothetical protein [Streptomyces sp. NBC_00654]MCX4963401.1 hypothetical protein [Streptomyces sp. NBC_00654]